jgi:hypothetical protein
MNFSIPPDVIQAFNETFRGRNKSAIVTQLMRDAIESERDDESTSRTISALRMLRATAQFDKDGAVARPTPRRSR